MAAAKLHRETWQRAYAGIVSDAFLKMLGIYGWVQRFSELLNDKSGKRQAIALRAEGTLAGVVTIQIREDALFGESCGEICSIYVLPRFWGIGYGQMLLREIEARFRDMGLKRYMLWVLEENGRARRAYERAGMKPGGQSETITIAEQPLIEISYVKEL